MPTPFVGITKEAEEYLRKQEEEFRKKYPTTVGRVFTIGSLVFLVFVVAAFASFIMLR